MALLPIRLFGDPVLRQHAQAVTAFDEQLEALAQDMAQTMHEAGGVGLAGNQVGVPQRVFTWYLPAEHSADGIEQEGVWINPRILDLSADLEEGEEGCLSLPGLFFPTTRPFRVKISAQDLRGELHEVEASSYHARILLHEMDHLDGILFLDHLAQHQREEAMGRIAAGELVEAAGDQAVYAR